MGCSRRNIEVDRVSRGSLGGLAEAPRAPRPIHWSHACGSVLSFLAVEVFVESMSLQRFWSENQKECGEALALLKDSVPRDKRQKLHGIILCNLVDDALDSLSRNNDWRPWTTSALHNRFYEKKETTKKEKPPAAWFSKHRDQIFSLQQDIYSVVNKRSLQRNVRYYLQFAELPMGEGAEKSYGFAVKSVFNEIPMINKNDAIEVGLSTKREESVNYNADLEPRFSFFGKLVFGVDGLVLSGQRRLLVLASILVPLLLLLALVYIVAWDMLAFSKPITSSDFVLILVILGFGYALTLHPRRFFILGNDRIVLAPDWALRAPENGTTIEIIGDRSMGDTPVIKVLRYTADCPICGGMIRIASGDPDFRRRLVGRCITSPREHVYSFDRSTKKGKPLITPY